MEEFKITEKMKNENLYRFLSIIFGLSLVYIFIQDRHISRLLLGLLLLFYSTYKKDVYISEEGLIYTYNALLFKRKEYLRFKDIEDITVVKQRQDCVIFFIKDPMAKKLAISEEKLDCVLDFIKRGSNISVRFES